MKKSFLEIICVLLGTAISFYAFGTNMRHFGAAVFLGFSYVSYTTTNLKGALLCFVVAGTIGAATEAWGCGAIIIHS